MLSIAQCRDLLGGGAALTDEEIKALRDQLYELAALVLDQVGPRKESAEESPR